MSDIGAIISVAQYGHMCLMLVQGVWKHIFKATKMQKSLSLFTSVCAQIYICSNITVNCSLYNIYDIFNCLSQYIKNFFWLIMKTLDFRWCTYLHSASTPALADALGTTNPDPLSAQMVVIAKKAAPENAICTLALSPSTQTTVPRLKVRSSQVTPQ